MMLKYLTSLSVMQYCSLVKLDLINGLFGTSKINIVLLSNRVPTFFVLASQTKQLYKLSKKGIKLVNASINCTGNYITMLGICPQQHADFYCGKARKKRWPPSTTFLFCPYQMS